MNDTNSAPAPIAYFAKCTRCKTVCRFEVGAEYKIERTPYRTLGERGWTTEYRERTIRIPRRGEDYGYLVLMSSVGRLISKGIEPHRCWTCGRALKIDRIEGRKTEHKCNAKCLSSKGPLCECACGGANHGKSWT